MIDVGFLLMKNVERIDRIGDCPVLTLPINADGIFWIEIKQDEKFCLQMHKITGVARIMESERGLRAWGSLTAMQEKFNRLRQEDFFRSGDVIGTFRRIKEQESEITLEYYAIYKGEGHVIGYVPGKTADGVEGIVKEMLLEEFTDWGNNCFTLFFPEGGMPVRVYFKTPAISGSEIERQLTAKEEKENISVFSPMETLKRAEAGLAAKQVGQQYHDSEHFALWCKLDMSKKTACINEG